VTSESMLV